jgi:transposase-like protein
MPYLSEKAKLTSKYDHRRKLSEQDKEDIIHLHARGQSIHSLARDYRVSRRTVQFIIYPERMTENLRLRLERGGSTVYYNREKQTKSVREHRRYKQKLYKEGLIE